MHTLISFVGFLVVAAVVFALILAAGGNLRCGIDRGEPGIVVIACQSALFDR